MARMWEGRKEVLHSAGGGGDWKTDFKSQSQLEAGRGRERFPFRGGSGVLFRPVFTRPGCMISGKFWPFLGQSFPFCRIGVVG